MRLLHKNITVVFKQCHNVSIRLGVVEIQQFVQLSYAIRVAAVMQLADAEVGALTR